MAGTQNFSKSFPTKGMDPGDLALMQADLHAQELGKYGLTDAGAGTHSGTYSAIQPINGSTVLTSATGENISIGARTLAEGNTVYGDFTQVVISSGRAILYHSKTS